MAESAYHKAVAYLARREHSRYELRQKLLEKEFLADEVESALDRLEELKLLSDLRYIAAMVRYKSGRGLGPNRIRQELQQHRLPSEAINAELATCNWEQVLQTTWQKKYRGVYPQDHKMRQKQINFLLYRGFGLAEIRSFLNSECDA